MATVVYIHIGAQPLYLEWLKQDPQVVRSWRDLARFLVDAEISDSLREMLRPGLNLRPSTHALAIVRERERRIESVYRRLLRQRKKYPREAFRIEIA